MHCGYEVHFEDERAKKMLLPELEKRNSKFHHYRSLNVKGALRAFKTASSLLYTSFINIKLLS